MILRIPHYFETFACKADRCEKSCCIGWELEVDEDTYDYYMNLPGPFGDRIRERLLNSASEDSPEHVYTFKTPENGYCPFLTENKLCEIVLNLGEEALCDICTNYPRYTFVYGDITMKSLTISCEEACRLMFEKDEPLKFLELPYPGENYEPLEDDPTKKEIEEFEERQKSLISTVQNRALPIRKRMEGICNLDKPGFSDRMERLRILSLLMPINDEWVEVLEKMLNGDSPCEDFEHFEYEHLLTYFLTRYLPRGLFDYDIDNKIEFSVFCVHAIHDMAFVMGSIVEAASLFSREVEHSEDNIDTIIEELLFD